jgi:DNA-binding transcriptional LysR family regulator
MALMKKCHQLTTKSFTKNGWRVSRELGAIQTAGMGIAPIERWIDNSRKDLIPLFESPEDWTNNLWLTTHRDAHNTPKIQAFTQFLKEELSNINLR